MLAAVFPQEITIGFDDGVERHFPALHSPSADNGHLPPEHVFLMIPEVYQNIARDCRNAGIALPLKVSEEMIQLLPAGPDLVERYFQDQYRNGKDSLNVCIINCGGGLGDGIMFAPAIKVLRERLMALCAGEVRISVYSSLPRRTATVLNGMDGVTIKALPFSWQEFCGYDFYVDFSGMLLEESWKGRHTTDYALQKMGLDAQTVADEEKQPFLSISGFVDQRVNDYLAAARERAGNRKLVALIFQSALTRSMPEALAARLLKDLAEEYQPALIMHSESTAAHFLREHDLASAVVDLSPASKSFKHFIALLAGMDAIVSVDTSAVHIGAALRKPTVAIFNSIAMENRIQYSPTVKGIQLAYRGRTCQAPCGLSKKKAYLSVKNEQGPLLHWEFSYACDEAVRKDTLLQETFRKLEGFDLSSADQSHLASIKEETGRHFAGGSAPCWQDLHPETVLNALKEVIHVGTE